MARIRRIRIAEVSAIPHPTEVDAELRRVNLSGGGALVQMSTFGSDGRRSEPKVSQTIQLDKAAAMQVRDFIDEVFGSAAVSE